MIQPSAHTNANEAQVGQNREQRGRRGGGTNSGMKGRGDQATGGDTEDGLQHAGGAGSSYDEQYEGGAGDSVGPGHFENDSLDMEGLTAGLHGSPGQGKDRIHVHDGLQDSQGASAINGPGGTAPDETKSKRRYPVIGVDDHRDPAQGMYRFFFQEISPDALPPHGGGWQAPGDNRNKPRLLGNKMSRPTGTLNMAAGVAVSDGDRSSRRQSSHNYASGDGLVRSGGDRRASGEAGSFAASIKRRDPGLDNASERRESASGALGPPKERSPRESHLS